MAISAPPAKRRRTNNAVSKRLARVTTKPKRQQKYHSSSEEEEDVSGSPVRTDRKGKQEQQDADIAAETNSESASEGEEGGEPEISEPEGPEDFEQESIAGVREDGSDATDGLDASDSEASTAATGNRKKRKRNDPDVFATGISKILGSKLTTSKRADPVLSRSKDAATASRELTDQKLEQKAKHKLREDKKHALEKGRVKDVLGLQSTETSTAEILEEEKRLRKIAQRGVVKLFNAVRAAQVKGEEAARDARRTGVIGMDKREEKITEMSKKGFLDLIAGGGKKPATATQET